MALQSVKRRPPRPRLHDARHQVDQRLHAAPLSRSEREGQPRDLRGCAASLALLGHLADGEVRAAVLSLAHLARIAATLHEGRAAADRLVTAGGAVGRRPAGTPEPVTPQAVAAVREALPAPVAAEVLDDPAWTLLAAELRATPDARNRLARVARRRELDTARTPAAVLHHRLVHGPGRRLQATGAEPTSRSGRTPETSHRPGKVPAVERRRR